MIQKKWTGKNRELIGGCKALRGTALIQNAQRARAYTHTPMRRTQSVDEEEVDKYIMPEMSWYIR